MRKLIAAGCALALTGCSSNHLAGFPPEDSGSTDAALDSQVQETGPESEAPEASLGFDASSLSYGSFDLGYAETDPMFYQGGNVMVAPIHVYAIWYGSWTDTNAVSIIEDLLSNIGSSSWFGITNLYYQQANAGVQSAARPHVRTAKVKHTPSVLDAGVEAGPADASNTDANVADSGAAEAGVPGPKYYVTDNITLAKSIGVGYPYGMAITDTDIQQVVNDQISNGQLPLDPTAAYFVFTSADVQEGGDDGSFCFDYCGWHNSAIINGSDIKFAFVGDVSACPDDCSVQGEYQGLGIMNSPNGDWSADGMATIIAHELSELSDDPDPLLGPVAWIDDQGYESDDKCAWTFGLPYLTKNGSVANVSIGSRDYMIQQNWILNDAGGYQCGLTP